MKKILILVITAVVSVFSLSASDFGLTVDSNYSLPFLGGEPVSFDAQTYSVKAALWANGSITDDMSYEFQGSYTLTESRNFFLELDQFQYNAKFFLPAEQAVIMDLKAGRLSFSDFSGRIFSHSGDGFSLSFGFPEVSATVFGTYTGLLQMPSNAIMMSASDVADAAVEPVPNWGPLGVPRLVEGITVTLPGFLEQQNIILSGIFQQDLRKQADLVEGGSTLFSFYAGLGFMGPMPGVSSLFYTLYGYGSSGWYGDNIILSFLSGAGINYLMPAFFSSRIALDFLYSSGDADHDAFYEGNTSGYSTAFIPITAAPAGLVFTDQQTNIFYISSSYSLKPFSTGDSEILKNTLVLLKPVFLFRSTAGPVQAGGVSEGATGLYLGTEIDLSIMARLFSDLGFSLNGGIYMPSAIMEVSSPQIKLSAALSLSF